jgi:hypothetical protein
MSQAGYTPIQLYFSTTAAAVPVNTNLANGELAINITDEKLYFKNAAGVVKLLASNATSAPVLSFSAGTTGLTPNTATTGAVTLAGTLATTNGGTGLTSFTANGVVYASSSSALATGSALYFDGTNLGVGTTSPYSNAAFSTLTLGGSSSSKTGLIALATSAGTDSAHIDVFNTQLRISTNGTTNPIVFYTGGSVSEAMRIDSSQNVGINNTSPAVLATTTQVAIKANSSADSMFVAQNSNGLTTAKFGFQFTGGVDNPVIGSYTDHPFIFQTNNTERARFTGSAGGSLLVGTSTLRVTGYTTGYSQYAMENIGYGGAQWFTNRADDIGSFIVVGKSRGTVVNSNTVVANGDELGALVFMGATGSGVASAAFVYAKVDGATINASSMPGRLSFHTTASGSTAPTEHFRIASTGAFGLSGANYGTAGQVLTSGGSAAAPTWTTVSGGGSQWTTTGSDIYYTTGNVGIGTVTPSSKLHVSGSGSLEAARFASTTDNNVSLGFYTNGSSRAKLEANSGNTYLTTIGATPLIFGTNDTERMRIDSTGKVSLTGGSISADAKVDIIGGNVTSEPARLLNISRGYYIHPGKVNNYYGLYSLLNGSDQDNSFTTASVYGEVNVQAGVGVIGKAGTVTSLAYGVVGWIVGNTDGYGTGSSFWAKYTRTGGGGANGGWNAYYCEEPNYVSTGSQLIGFYWNSLYTGANTRKIADFIRNGTQVGSITCSTTNTAYNTSSDYRLKENVVPITGALERVSRLKPVAYNWKVDQTYGEGFIAHELAEVLPLAVTGAKDETRYEEYVITPEVSNVVTVPAEHDANGNEITPERQEKVVITPAEMGSRVVPIYQGVDTSFLVATLTAAIQEQQALIVALTARIDALEAK